MSRFKKLVVEIHRRSLWHLLGSYIVGAWLVLQLAETVASLIGLPLWFGASVIALLALGFVLVLTTGLVKVAASLRSEPERTRTALHKVFTWRNALIAGSVAVAVLVVGTAGYMGLRVLGVGPAGTLIAKGVLDEQDRIVLADFANHANDSLVAITVTEALRVDLSQSPAFRVAEPSYVAGVLERMGVAPGTPLDGRLAREVAIREGLKAMVSGDVTAAGPGYVFAAHLVAPEGGEALVNLRETARDSSQLIAAIERLSRRLRERVGESLKSIRGNPPLEQVTTSSLAALRSYSQAARAFGLEGDRRKARALYEEAIALDTTFAMAYRNYAITLWNSGITGERYVQTLTRAYELSARLPARERLLTAATYYHGVVRDQEKAIAAYRALLDAYPTESTALINLAIIYGDHGETERAVGLNRRAIEADSSRSWIPYTNLFFFLLRLRRLDEAGSTLEAAAARFPGHPNISLRFAQLAIARGDYNGAEHQLRALAEDRTLDVQGYRNPHRWLAWLAQTRGQLGEAERQIRLLMASSERDGRISDYIRYAAWLGLLDLWFRGDTSVGMEQLDAALERYPLPDMPVRDRPYICHKDLLGPIALVPFYAAAGRPDSARALLAQLEAAVDLQELRRNYRYNHSRAYLALAEGRTQEANEIIRQEPGFFFLPLLGRAYDRAEEPDSAIAVYERYVGRTEDDKIMEDAFHLAWTYERLAYLYEQSADTANAIRYYARLVDLWEDADPELQPRVDAARRAIEALTPDT